MANHKHQKISEIPLPALNTFVRLTPLEEDLVNTPAMQRLRGIMQLGLAYLVYPQAKHDRFTHALTTSHITKMLCDYLSISEDKTKLLVAAALLHDLGHTPFSHVTETFLSKIGYNDHIEWTAALIAGKEKMPDFVSEIPRILKSHKISAEDVAKLVRRKYENEKYLQEILFGEVDADVLAYLSLDAYHTIGGVSLDIERVMRTLKIHNGRLCIFDKGLPAINAVFELRNLMYKRVYFHHGVRIADGMLRKALALAIDEIPNFYILNDGELLYELSRSKNEITRELVKRINERKLLKRAFCKKSFEIKKGSQDYIRLYKLRELVHEGKFDLSEKICEEVKGLDKNIIVVDFAFESLLFSEPRAVSYDFNVYLAHDDKVVKIAELLPKTIEAYAEEGCRPEYCFIVAVPEEYVEKVGKAMENIWREIH